MKCRLRSQTETTQVRSKWCIKPTPYNLQSLRDLYTQVPEQTERLKRFGSDVFLNRGLATKQMPVDIPIGPDYILGAGDGLIINLWGGVSQSFARTVDREGKIALPEAGAIVVAGLSLERAQALIQNALEPTVQRRKSSCDDRSSANRESLCRRRCATPRRLRYQFLVDAAQCTLCGRRTDECWLTSNCKATIAERCLCVRWISTIFCLRGVRAGF